jgi:hypothetical protein
MPTIGAFERNKALQSLIRAQKELDLRALAAEDRFMKAIIKSQARMYRRMAEVINAAPDLSSLSLQKRLAWYVENSAAIQAAAKNNGYYAAVRSYVNEYPGLGGISKKILAAGRVPKEFTTIPKELVDRVMNRDYAWFDMLNREALAQLDKTILDSVIVGSQKFRALGELKGKITGSYPWGTRRGLYEWHAGTYARTAHVRATREFMAVQAEEAKIENFIYIGPLDGKTRPFCVDLVGNVFSKTEIEEMDNGQTGLVLSDGGGWNCRHSWDPVYADLAAALKATPEQNQASIQQSIPAKSPEIQPSTIPPTSSPNRFSTADPTNWSKANSIDEAESWARANGLAKKVDYQGLHLDVANELNRRVGMFLREFPQLKETLKGLVGFQKAARVGIRTLGRNSARIDSVYEYGRRVRRAAALRRSRQNIAELHPEMTKEQVNALARTKLAENTKYLDDQADQISKAKLKKEGVSGKYRPQYASAWGYTGGEGIVMEDLWFTDTPISWVKFLKSGGSLCWKEKGSNVWKVIYGHKGITSKSIEVQNAKEAFKWGKISKDRLEMTKRTLRRGAEQNRFAPSSGGISGTIDHEMGHILDYAFGLQKDPEFVTLIKNYATKGKPWLVQNLSEYGTANVAELIAESWAEFVANPTGCREVAKRLGTYILDLAGKTV